MGLFHAGAVEIRMEASQHLWQGLMTVSVSREVDAQNNQASGSNRVESAAELAVSIAFICNV